MKPAPKPTKKPKPKTPKGKSICVECGEIWRGKNEVHEPGCRNSIRAISFRNNKTDKQMYEAALDHMCRLITTWRDGCTCVINDSYCNDVSNWGHVVPQGRNAYLIYELSNSFRQCAKHNELHRGVQYPYLEWYRRTWGNLAEKMLEEARVQHKGGRNAQELFELLLEYVKLWSYRYFANTIEEKVKNGYYGDIIREAWIKEGRI